METVEHTKDAWYVSKTGDHQGLVVSEATGENIAVVYDKANAPLMAAAPDLLVAIRDIAGLAQMQDVYDVAELHTALADIFNHAVDAIAKAE